MCLIGMQQGALQMSGREQPGLGGGWPGRRLRERNKPSPSVPAQSGSSASLLPSGPGGEAGKIKCVECLLRACTVLDTLSYVI